MPRLDREPTADELAAELGMPAEDVRRPADDLTRTPVVFRPARRLGSA